MSEPYDSRPDWLASDFDGLLAVQNHGQPPGCEDHDSVSVCWYNIVCELRHGVAGVRARVAIFHGFWLDRVGTLALGLGMAAKIAAHASGRLNRLRYDRLVVKWGWGRAKPCCLWIGRAMLPCLNLSVAM